MKSRGGAKISEPQVEHSQVLVGQEVLATRRTKMHEKYDRPK
jgi:hypothetical protein